MNLLLDTHALLWGLAQPERLPRKIQGMIADQRNRIYFSVVSVWEIAIKHAIPRRVAMVPADELAHYAEEAGYDVLPVKLAHVLGVEALPLIHLDPFDRLIVAQALAEGFRLVTHDAQLQAYDTSVIAF